MEPKFNGRTTWRTALFKKTFLGSSGLVTKATAFSYDAAGNMLSKTEDGVQRNYQYNTLDQLLNDGIRTYAYDPRGNVASITDAGGATTLSYDAANRLIGANVPGRGAANYGYDGEGRRIAQSILGSSTQLLWDPMSPRGVGDIVVESSGVSYAFGEATPLWRDGGSSTAFYVEDGQNSIVGMTNQTAALTDRFRYDAFGQSRLRTGTTPNPFQYRSQWTDPLTGFQDLRARHYNPASGRFLTRDTFGFDDRDPVDFNRYRYAGSNPVNAYDPTGHNNVIEYIMSAQGIQGLSAYSEYGEQRISESFLIASMNALVDMTSVAAVQTVLSSYEPLREIASLVFGDYRANRFVTISSGRGIPFSSELLIDQALAMKDPQAALGIYQGSPRRSFASISGVKPESRGKRDNVISEINALLESVFGKLVDLAGDGAAPIDAKTMLKEKSWRVPARKNIHYSASAPVVPFVEIAKAQYGRPSP